MSKYEIKEQIDKMMFGTFNIASQVIFKFKAENKLVRNNHVFEDKHKGERCFIIGTGPSLRHVDLTLLKNETVFGVNYLYKGDQINDLNIRYYFLYDELFYTDCIADTKEVFDRLPNTIFFVRTNAYNRLKSNGMLNNNVFFQSCGIFQNGDLVRLDLTKNMTAPYNVILGCIQTAIYMGFTDIYLLGCDFNSFASLKVEHFYDEPNSESPNRNMTLGYEMKFYSMVAYHHYALEKYARRNDINICNVTENSLLDAYRRKNYTDLFSE